MKRHLKSIIALALGALILSSATATAGCSRATVAGANAVVPQGRINQPLLDAAILIEVNYERCRHGLRALKAEPRLRTTAEGHSRWMARARTVSHKSNVAGRSSLKQRMKRSGVSFREGGENISMLHYYQIDGRTFLTRGTCQFTTTSGAPLPAHSYNSLARSAVAYWMASSGHRRNILNRNVRMMGAAASVDQDAQHCGTVYLTQNFAG